jgi:hypothetical protein
MNILLKFMFNKRHVTRFAGQKMCLQYVRDILKVLVLYQAVRRRAASPYVSGNDGEVA